MKTKSENNTYIFITSSIPKTKNNKKTTFIEKDEFIIEQALIVNKGTGAGGANTNYYGKKFEEKTNNQIRLLNTGYTKNIFTKKQKKHITYQKLLMIKLLYLYYKIV